MAMHYITQITQNNSLKQ